MLTLFAFVGLVILWHTAAALRDIADELHKLRKLAEDDCE